MEFTIELLESLIYEGKEMVVNSAQLAKLIAHYGPSDFSDFSPRSFYFWKEQERPIPLSVAIKIIKKERVRSITIESFSVNGGNKIFPPNEKDESLYYFLGLILGDGCLIHSKKRGNRNTYLVQITFREKISAEMMKKWVEKSFNLIPSIYPGRGCFNLCIFSKPLVIILHKKYDIPLGLKYSSIKVPEIIKNCSSKRIKLFLRGVFDSDGNIYLHRGKKSVQLRQKSYSFLKELKDLFLKIGVEFREPYQDIGNNSWVLWTSKKKTVDNFINKIMSINICPGSSAWIEHLPSKMSGL